MSRIGKKPIKINEGVTVNVDTNIVKIGGEKGEIDIKLPEGISAQIVNNQLEIQTSSAGKQANLQGLVRSLINNATIGVLTGWSKTLELVGVGFRAQTDGAELTLSLGFSHPVKITAPKGISFRVAENTITVLGADKYLVGEIAASIRRNKPPEPYKGKGIRYVNEHIRKKLGKAAKAVGGGAAK